MTLPPFRGGGQCIRTPTDRTLLTITIIVIVLVLRRALGLEFAAAITSAAAAITTAETLAAWPAPRQARTSVVDLVVVDLRPQAGH